MATLSKTKASFKRTKQLSLNLKTWGGKRTGAGRKNRSGSVNHMAREKLTGKQPIHINQRLRRGLSGMRTRTVHELLKTSLRGMKNLGVAVNHYSLQGNHLHMILEAPNNATLACAMKSFGCRFGKGVKRLLGFRVAKVFNGRYHAEVSKTPMQMRNTLRYVLLNESKHADLIEYIDQFSSGFYFRAWAQLTGKRFAGLLKDQISHFEKKARGRFELPDHLSPPTTWLLREGWLRAVNAGILSTASQPPITGF